MVVVDASAMIELLLQTDAGRRVEDRLLREGEDMHAPHVLDVEVAQVLRRIVQRKEVTAARAGEALDDLASLQVARHAHVDLVGRIWELRGNVSAYDGVYVALAEALDAPLVTCDGALAAAPGHRANVELIIAA